MQKKESIQKQLYKAIRDYANAGLDSRKDRLQDIDMMLKQNKDLANNRNPVTKINIIAYPDVIAGVPDNAKGDLLETFYKNGFTQTNDFLNSWMNSLIGESQRTDQSAERILTMQQKIDKEKSIEDILNLIEKYEGKQVKTEKMLSHFDNYRPEIYIPLLKRADPHKLNLLYQMYIRQNSGIDENILKAFKDKGMDISYLSDHQSVYTYYFTNTSISVQDVEKLQKCGAKLPDDALETYVGFAFRFDIDRKPGVSDAIIDYLAKTKNLSDPEVAQKIMNSISDSIGYNCSINKGQLKEAALIIHKLQEYGFDIQSTDKNGNTLKHIMAEKIERMQNLSPEFQSVLKGIKETPNNKGFTPSQVLDKGLKKYVNEMSYSMESLTFSFINNCRNIGATIDVNHAVGCIAQNKLVNMSEYYDEENLDQIDKMNTDNKQQFEKLPKDTILTKEGIYGAITLNVPMDKIAKHVFESVKNSPEFANHEAAQKYIEDFADLYVLNNSYVRIPEEIESSFQEFGINIYDNALSARFAELDDRFREDLDEVPMAKNDKIVSGAQISIDLRKELTQEMESERENNRQYNDFEEEW